VSSILLWAITVTPSLKLTKAVMASLRSPYLKYEDEGDIIKCLEKYMDDIEKLRYNAVDKSDTTIQNLIDDALATYLSTLYKLRHLR
jgi:hypothetical protein